MINSRPSVRSPIFEIRTSRALPLFDFCLGVKTPQASGLVFGPRELLVRQLTQAINAIRAHLAEYGWVCRAVRDA
ncbi:MAG: hypothetical protein ACO1OD_04315 [Croceibacterium sp.]